ncbi:protein GVQW3-like [Penaeus monodon]|uniref:protein GVQW3-like n=1 Tax=Penaeus monodon TaxID=6687 RepID=UPI0018A6ECC0|nr:protein GVQW3-like [Penaeus monodon]
MQSGREDTLEARYAIKVCVKLEKNTTQTYELLQTAYGLSCMGRESVFRWHKKFKGGRESVRDDERYEDRRESIETISDKFEVSVGTVHKIIHDELNMRKICARFVPRVLSDEQKARRQQVELISSDPRVLMALVTCDESWIYCYDPETKSQSFQWKHPAPPLRRRPNSASPT